MLRATALHKGPLRPDAFAKIGLSWVGLGRQISRLRNLGVSGTQVNLRDQIGLVDSCSARLVEFVSSKWFEGAALRLAAALAAES